MNIIEFAVSLLAPHLCLSCGLEGRPLCRECASRLLRPPPSCCYRCKKPSEVYKTCRACLAFGSPLQAVYIAAQYDGVAKELLAAHKFQRMKAAASDIARWLDKSSPPLPPGIIISPVPTASSRIRARGYDQARLIAADFASRRRLPFHELLWRTSTTRQVGAGRAERFEHLKNAFAVRHPERLRGEDILIIDDVLTTGATLESAANALLEAGAKSVRAAVFAH